MPGILVLDKMEQGFGAAALGEQVFPARPLAALVKGPVFMGIESLELGRGHTRGLVDQAAVRAQMVGHRVIPECALVKQPAPGRAAKGAVFNLFRH